MIASISGEISEIDADSIVVRLGGLGIRLYIPTPLRSSCRVNQAINLHTYLVVREDALSLFGFETPDERDFFLLLLGVNGVGPRIALSILSVLTPDTMRRAVVNEQSDLFSRVPGVGKKTAQKILLHLQGKIRGDTPLEAVSSISLTETEVIEALTGLGYSIVEAQTALQAIPRDAPADLESRLRLALQYFNK